jgi:hypothetical protein
MSGKLGKAASHTPSVRVCAALLLLLGGSWALFQSKLGNSSSSGTNDGSSSGRLQELLGCWHVPGLATQAQADLLKVKLQYKHFYVSQSTIPGAGLGVFAKHDMPAGGLSCSAGANGSSHLKLVPHALATAAGAAILLCTGCQCTACCVMSHQQLATLIPLAAAASGNRSREVGSKG